MPAADVSDLRDVVDAINKLCDTMKTSADGPDDDAEPTEGWGEPAPEDRSDRVAFDPEPTKVELETFGAQSMTFDPEPAAFVSESALPAPPTLNPEPAASDPEPPRTEDKPIVFDPELAVFDPEPAPTEPISEMYYTASSEVSLLSDTAQGEDSDRERDDRDSVMAGHVAAMRERFESMTRTNTPCPDLMRSTSPSFEVFRNISSSPDIEKT